MKIENYNFTLEDTLIHVPMISYRHFTEPLPRHSHSKNAFELHYVTAGKGFVVLENQIFPLSPGVLYITGPNIAHEQIPDESESLTEFGLFFLISESESNSPLADQFIKHELWLGDAGKEVDALAQAILWEKTNQKPGYRQKIPLLLAELMIECVRNFVSDGKIYDNKLPVPSNKLSVDLLQEENTLLVIDEIFLCRYADITLEQLADSIGLSTRQAQRLLEKNYNKSFSSMKLEARMAAAETLLRNSSLKITEISNRIGYSSIEHFSNAFKKFYGVSPGQYRKI
ncbi:MAG: AraC family transcriptional regulator [Eubacterium sp.]|nr:AraC family transcriptional regulator [Eubacterium sp.]